MRLSQALLSIIIAAPAATIAFSPSSSSLSRSIRVSTGSLPRPSTCGIISNYHHRTDTTRSTQFATVEPIVNVDASTPPPPSKDATDDEPVTPLIRLSVEEKAKTVISVCTSGTLCTSSTQDGIDGAPFGSYVDYVLDDGGNPILLMNEMSMHTLNIANDPNGMVTLFAQLGGKPKAGDDGSVDDAPRGQDVSRCSITGTVEKIDHLEEGEDFGIIRMRYSITHVYADQVMDSPRFAFYRIRPVKVYFVGGFGVSAKWVPVEEYRDAVKDILAEEATDIVAKLNRDHGSDLWLTAEHLLDCGGDIEMVRVTNLDRLGMDIRVTTIGKRRNKLNTDEFRIGFRIPVMSVEDAKSEVLKVFQEAWEKGEGYSWGEEENELPGSDIPILKIAADGLGLNK